MALECTLYDVQGVQPAVVIIPGQIAGETTGPTYGALVGKKFTVAYTATGIYTVTFASALGTIISVVASLGATAAGDIGVVDGFTAHLSTITTAGFKVHVYNASAVAEAIPDLAWINFIAVGTNSSLE